MYEKGLGVGKDDEMARKWYLVSAEQDNVRGQHRLARLLRKGLGGPQDLVESYKLDTLAMEKRPSHDKEAWRGWVSRSG